MLRSAMAVTASSKPPILPSRHSPAFGTEFASADRFKERGTGILAFDEGFAIDVHGEEIAASVGTLGNVLFDLGDAAAGGGKAAFRSVDRAADCMLVVKMGVVQSVQSRELGFEPCFLHQPRIAGCDRFGHGKLIDLRSGVFEAADAAIAGHGHIDEPRLSLEHLPVRGVDACFGGVSVEFYLIILIALAFNATLALLNMRGSQGTSR